MDEITLLTAVRPDLPENADEIRAAARSRLLSVTGGGRHGVLPMRSPRSPVRRRVAAVAVAATAAAAALVVTQTVAFDGSSVTIIGPSAEAATLLNEAAAAADADPGRTRAGDTLWTQTLTEQNLLPRLRGDRVGGPELSCVESWEKAGFPGWVATMRPDRCPDRVPSQVPSPEMMWAPEPCAHARTYPDPAGLSADPAELLDQVNRWLAEGQPERRMQVPYLECRGTVLAFRASANLSAFTVLAAMLNDNLGYPHRSSLYRALARIPGIELTRGVADAAGRRGDAVGITEAHISQQIILSTGTHRYLGYRYWAEHLGTIRTAQLRTAVFPAGDR